MISRTERSMHNDKCAAKSPQVTNCRAFFLRTPFRRLRVAFSTVIEVGKVETTFIDIVGAGNPVPDNLAGYIPTHSLKYHPLRSLPRVLGPLCIIRHLESVTSGRSKISEVAARNLASYFRGVQLLGKSLMDGGWSCFRIYLQVSTWLDSFTDVPRPACWKIP